MASAAISYGTEIWLAELKRDGWTLTVSEQLRPNRTLHLADDEFEPMTLVVPAFEVGVLATDEHGSGVFVACGDKESAWRLLQAVEDEVAGVV